MEGLNFYYNSPLRNVGVHSVMQQQSTLFPSKTNLRIKQQPGIARVIDSSSLTQMTGIL